MKDLLKQLCNILRENKEIVLVSVVQHQGSTPRGAGSKMLVDKSGLIAGTIGGGLAEGVCIEACAEVLQSKKDKLIHFTLTGHMVAQSEMICGGNLDILLSPLQGAQDLAFYEALVEALDTGEAHVLHYKDEQDTMYRSLYVNDQWTKGIWQESPLSDATKTELLAKLGKGEESTLHQDKEAKSFFVMEKYVSPWQMIILGGGHVSRPTAQMAAMVGFQVTVIDDRKEFSTAERFPWAHATYTVPEFLLCFSQCPPTKQTCIVIITRGHVHDSTVLNQALKTQASYIGMIGSKRKRQEVYTSLEAQGVNSARLAQVHCPIGIDISAQTPEEIAVSIVGECIAHRRKQ